MSYDLVFRFDAAVKNSEIEGYFRSNKNYSVAENSKSLVYQNEDTGAYFVVDQNEEADELENDDRLKWNFNLNYYRPSYFALEAWTELEGVIQRFKPEVFDPQNDDEAPFTRDRFLSGWDEGNRFACRTISEENGERPETLPHAELHRIWRWNSARDGLQKQMGENVFVPRIMFGRADGIIGSAAVWPDGIPCVMPPVDLVIIGREALSPWRLLGRKKETFFVPWRIVSPVIEAVAEGRTADGFVLRYSKTPEVVERFVKGLKSNDVSFEGLPADQVLDEEFFTGDAISSFPS